MHTCHKYSLTVLLKNYYLCTQSMEQNFSSKAKWSVSWSSNFLLLRYP